MATYSLGQNYKKLVNDGQSYEFEVFAIKALGGDVTVTATAAATDSDDLVTQPISDGDVITCATGWQDVTRDSGDGVVIVYPKNNR
jgi:hypothetical protein